MMDDDKDTGLDWGEPVSTYTREQGIEDGVLVQDPLKDLAKEAGFAQPLVFTWALYGACEAADGADGDATATVRRVLGLGAIVWRREVVKRQADPRGMPTEVGPLDYEVKIGGKVREVWLYWNSHEAFTVMFPEDC